MSYLSGHENEQTENKQLTVYTKSSRAYAVWVIAVVEGEMSRRERVCAHVSQIVALGVIIAAVEVRAEGPYASVYGGANALSDAHLKAAAIVPGFPGIDAKIEFDSGFVVGGTAGYRFGDTRWNLGVETDISYRENKIGKLDVKSDGGLGALLGVGSLKGSYSDIHGEVSALAALANLWLNVETGGLAHALPGWGGRRDAPHAKQHQGNWFGCRRRRRYRACLATGSRFSLQRDAGPVSKRRLPLVQRRRCQVQVPADRPEKFESTYSSHSVLAAMRFTF
jgi:hypothetical protein